VVLKIKQTFVFTKYNQSMVTILFKWLICLIPFTGQLVNPASKISRLHPVFMSVTEIEHNASAKRLEVSCKIFTDDFEKTLRTKYKGTVDLIHPADKAAMDKLVSNYVLQHLQIVADGKPVNLQFIGYEIIEEGVVSYYEAAAINAVKKLEITDTILYEYKAEQISIIHAIVGGERKSIKLNNPEAKAILQF